MAALAYLERETWLANGNWLGTDNTQALGTQVTVSISGGPMAERKLLFVNTDGYHEEHDATSDTVTFAGITMNGDIAMGSNKITGLANGTANNDAVNYSQLQSVINGLDWKASVRAASDSDIDLGVAADPSPVDGVTLADGDRILLKGQTAGAENGIYVAVDADDPTTWVRSEDANTDAEVTAGLSVVVEEGTSNGDKAFMLETNDPITVDTTALSFVSLNISQLVAGDGIDITGFTVSADLAAGEGLKFVTGEIAVEPGDFAGTGLQDDGSDNLEIDFADTSSEMGTQRAVAAADLSANGADQGAKILGADPSGIFYSSSTTIQGVLEDLDDAIAAVDTQGVNYTVGTGGVTAGDLVYVSANNTVVDLDDPTQPFYVVGIAATTESAAGTVKVLANDEVILAPTIAGSPSAGDRIFWDGTQLTDTIPATANYHVWQAGIMKNATDLHVEVLHIKKNV